MLILTFLCFYRNHIKNESLASLVKQQSQTFARLLCLCFSLIVHWTLHYLPPSEPSKLQNREAQGTASHKETKKVASVKNVTLQAVRLCDSKAALGCEE